MANSATKNPTDIQAVNAYVISIFDGVFSENDIVNHRNKVFYRLSNFVSPKTQRLLSEVLSEDQIGDIINMLDTLQFNKRLSPRVARAGEAQF